LSRIAVYSLHAAALCVLLTCFSANCQEPAGTPGAQPLESVAAPGLGALEGTVGAGDYILGPGDVLLVGFWGGANRTETVTVNPDGDALVAPVGPLHVAGLTLAMARNLITESLSVYYKPGVLSVSLVSLRRFRVHVVGMVLQPGALEANAVTRVSQAVSDAGGLAEGASQRGIRVSRGGDTLRVDLTRYLLLGDNATNPFLSDGDVVYVPPRSEMVYVYGSVYRQGGYEFVDGEAVLDLVDLAGGLRPEAFTDSMEIERFDSLDPGRSETFFVSGDSDVLTSLRLRPGDRVFVRAIEDWHRDAKVTVEGEVRYPGIYVIDDGAETLSQVIARAGGLTDKASLAEARLMRNAYALTDFPVEADAETLKGAGDILSDKDRKLAWTLSREPKGAVSVNFEDVFGGKGRLDPVLYDGDVISIPEAFTAVRVSGQVKNPGLVAFKPGAPYSYYVKQVGGFASGADVRGMRIVTAESGQMIKTGSARIRPGDIIWVPTKTDRSWWDVTKDVIQVVAQMATIYIVADQIASR
jgi:protein involved in polysaccharide export with SLBB domain